MGELLQHLINGVSLGTIYALMALGYTMVYGVLRLINFAHADVFMVGAYFGLFSAKAMELKYSKAAYSFCEEFEIQLSNRLPDAGIKNLYVSSQLPLRLPTLHTIGIQYLCTIMYYYFGRKV